MSASPAQSITTNDALNTTVGRITNVHISHGGGLAPATSEAVVGTSPDAKIKNPPQETPQRAPQANWLEGLVRSIQGRGGGQGREGGSVGQPPPPPYPPSEEEEEEEFPDAAVDAAAGIPPGSLEASRADEGEGPSSSYIPFGEDPLEGEAERVLGILKARLGSLDALRLEEELRGSQENVQALRRELQAFKEDAKNRERLAQAEVNHLREQVERARWGREGFGPGPAATLSGAAGGSSMGEASPTMAQAIASMGRAVENAISRASIDSKPKRRLSYRDDVAFTTTDLATGASPLTDPRLDPLGPSPISQEKTRTTSVAIQCDLAGTMNKEPFTRREEPLIDFSGEDLSGRASINGGWPSPGIALTQPLSPLLMDFRNTIEVTSPWPPAGAKGEGCMHEPGFDEVGAPRRGGAKVEASRAGQPSGTPVSLDLPLQSLGSPAPVSTRIPRADDWQDRVALVATIMDTLALQRGLTPRDARCIAMIATRTVHDLGLEWSTPAVLHLHSGSVCSGAAGELAIRSVFFRRALVCCGGSMDCGATVLREGRPCDHRSRRSSKRRQRRGRGSAGSKGSKLAKQRSQSNWSVGAKEERVEGDSRSAVQDRSFKGAVGGSQEGDQGQIGEFGPSCRNHILDIRGPGPGPEVPQEPEDSWMEVISDASTGDLWAGKALEAIPEHIKRHLESDQLRYVSLMAGVGGRSLGYNLDSDLWTGSAIEMVPQFVAVHTANIRGVQVYEHKMAPSMALPPTFPRLEEVTHLSAGPPCQPYSRAGKGEGQEDPRDGIPAVLQAIEELMPLIVELENVPEIQKYEGVVDSIISRLGALGYWVNSGELLASDFGVPQRRRRFFIVGSLLGPVGMPKPTTAGHPVTVEQAIGSGTEFNAFQTYDPALTLTPGQQERAERLDILSRCVHLRELHPDRPARTLTASGLANNHALMPRLRLDDGETLRRLSVGEAARLQSFPPWYVFHEEVISERQAYIGIGNAVPPVLGQHLSKLAREHVQFARENYRKASQRACVVESVPTTQETQRECIPSTFTCNRSLNSISHCGLDDKDFGAQFTEVAVCAGMPNSRAVANTEPSGAMRQCRGTQWNESECAHAGAPTEEQLDDQTDANRCGDALQGPRTASPTSVTDSPPAARSGVSERSTALERWEPKRGGSKVAGR
ncbi:hypothetical protein AB1Y20_018900 [Prymnesium parvum]|uniref:DNA (cytosine-5-)-methyltransferase n=1 Tax=Prymnesium parvum TaxID=97485 RepID=A0AB34JR30_PRYPA